MDINEFKTCIDNIDKINNKKWTKDLVDRKLKEIEFADRQKDETILEQAKSTDTYEKLYSNVKYYKTVKRSTDYSDNWVRSRCSKGGYFLDYACGNGSFARKAAQAGAELALGIDISSVSIKNAIKLAADNNLTNTKYFQADAENSGLPDNCIDSIVCSGVLHHMDLSYVFPELRRILKPGGKILAIEALDYNPLIKIYRHLTPGMRTEWEKAHILSLKDVEFAKRFFTLGDVKYWHVVGYGAGKFPLLSRPLEMVDKIIEKIPLVRRLAWMFTFELIK